MYADRLKVKLKVVLNPNRAVKIVGIHFLFPLQYLHE